MKVCANCGKKLERYDTRYCSNQCQNDYQYKEYIEKWKRKEATGMTSADGQFSNHVKRYMFEKYNSKCCKCGWSQVNPYTGRIPLEVSHIDGDPTNTYEENLELICPNCHSLTPSHKGANVGNGRKNRKR